MQQTNSMDKNVTLIFSTSDPSLARPVYQTTKPVKYLKYVLFQSVNARLMSDTRNNVFEPIYICWLTREVYFIYTSRIDLLLHTTLHT